MSYEPTEGQLWNAVADAFNADLIAAGNTTLEHGTTRDYDLERTLDGAEQSQDAYHKRIQTAHLIATQYHGPSNLGVDAYNNVLDTSGLSEEILEALAMPTGANGGNADKSGIEITDGSFADTRSSWAECEAYNNLHAAEWSSTNLIEDSFEQSGFDLEKFCRKSLKRQKRQRYHGIREICLTKNGKLRSLKHTEAGKAKRAAAKLEALDSKREAKQSSFAKRMARKAALAGK